MIKVLRMGPGFAVWLRKSWMRQQEDGRIPPQRLTRAPARGRGQEGRLTSEDEVLLMLSRLSLCVCVTGRTRMPRTPRARVQPRLCLPVRSPSVHTRVSKSRLVHLESWCCECASTPLCCPGWLLGVHFILSQCRSVAVALSLNTQ